MKVGIVGLGLIGGSLALAFREAGHHVVGIDPDSRTRSEALRRGGADVVDDAYAALVGTNVVLLAVPLGLIEQVAGALLPSLPPGTIVTDAGSVKGSIVSALGALAPEGVSYVGGHPMFGVERRGFDAALASLVRGAPFILTPRPDTDPRAVSVLTELVTSIGMKPVLLSPEEHDARLATLSHLPQLLAVALSLEAADTTCAGPSFLGATRTAMSPPSMLANIVRMNRPAIEAALASLSTTLRRLSIAPDEELTQQLEEARARRLALERTRAP